MAEYRDPIDDPVGVRAAHSVLVEVLTILGEVADAIVVIGGSVPPLVVTEPADDPYVGTLDVDVALDTERLDEVADDVYAKVVEHLEGRGYRQVEPPFRWIRTVAIDGQEVDVYLDLLAAAPEALGKNRRHVRFQEEGRARRLEGGEILSRLRQEVRVEGTLPDGRRNAKSANVAAPGALIVLKAIALESRDKPKDSYDIDYVLAYAGDGGSGSAVVAEQLRPFRDEQVVQRAAATLREKFADADEYGPQSVAVYRRLELGSTEADEVQAQAFARVQDFLARLQA